VAAELLCGAQGLEWLKPLTPGRGVGRLYQRIREAEPAIAPLTEDRAPAEDLEQLAALVASGDLDPAILVPGIA